jgi:D-alanyl-D-alanine dipeptidase
MTICYRETGEEVDMGSHFDYFGEPSHTMFLGSYVGGHVVTKKHQENRLLLRRIMVKHGFKPYESEWWHFTLKKEPYPNTYFNFPVQ